MRKLLRGLISFALVFSLLLPMSFAEYVGLAKTTDNLRLRKKPSLSAAILATASAGQSVTITQEEPVQSEDGIWYAVTYNGQEGYMSADYLDVLEQNAEVSEKGYINGSGVNFRTQPTTDSDIIRSFTKYTEVEITGTDNGWFSIRYNETDGYVRCDFVALGSSGHTASSSAASSDYTLATSTLNSISTTDTQRAIVEKALNYLGKPYVYGASGPNSFDCSGFTSYVYKQSGYSINRTALDQYRLNGSAVGSKAELLPGDLVFFRDTSVSTKAVSHVGIYIGDGLFVHSGSGNSGAGRCVKISELNTGYYNRVYVGGKRIV